MKKVISEQELNRIIREAANSILNENSNTKYALNNLTWKRVDGTDNNTSRLTPEAIEVRKYIIKEYPSVSTLNGFNTNAAGYDINAVFSAMKSDIISHRTRPDSQKIADGEESNKLFTDLSGAVATTLKNGLKGLKLKNGVIVFNNGRFTYNGKIGNVPQNVKAKVDELLKQNNLLSEVTWNNASLGTAENLDSPIFKKLAKDFGMLLDVSCRRSGMFRNWGSDHTLDTEAKEKICNMLNINYVASKYATSGDDYEGQENEEPGAADGNGSDAQGGDGSGAQGGNGGNQPTQPTKPKVTYNANIQELQRMLNYGGYTNPHLKEDGKLGPKTRAAAKLAGVTNPEKWTHLQKFPMNPNPANVIAGDGQKINTTTQQSTTNAQQVVTTQPQGRGIDPELQGYVDNAIQQAQQQQQQMAEAKLKKLIKKEILREVNERKQMNKVRSVIDNIVREEIRRMNRR